MRYLILLAFGLTPLYSNAKLVNEPMTVTQMSWSSEKELWRLTMLRHAAVYWAPKEMEKCLLESLHKQKDVKLHFDTKTLIISKCE